MGTCSEAICKHRVAFPSMEHIAWYSQRLPVTDVGQKWFVRGSVLCAENRHWRHAWLHLSPGRHVMSREDRRINWTPYLVIVERFQAIYGGQRITSQIVGITAGWLTVEAGRRVVAVGVIGRVRPLLLLRDFVVISFRCVVYKVSDVNKCT